jgi:phosphatidylglycerophosphate synthase
MAEVRLNNSFLAVKERAALAALVERLPPSVQPDHLTAIGLLGAVLTAAGFIGCHWSASFLFFVVFGLFLNWFGDSLDGTLARRRKIERLRYGYLIDHSTDLIAQTLIIVGLGVSPYFTLLSALFVLSLYLLMSSYTYLRVAAERVHRLSYGGMGATELRLLIAAWALFAAWAGPELINGRILNYIGIDVVIGGLSACTFALFVFIVRGDLARFNEEDGKGTNIYRLEPKRFESWDRDSGDQRNGRPTVDGDVTHKRAAVKN